MVVALLFVSDKYFSLKKGVKLKRGFYNQSSNTKNQICCPIYDPQRPMNHVASKFRIGKFQLQKSAIYSDLKVKVTPRLSINL